MCLGIPGQIVEVYREDDLQMGKVDFGGVTRRVCLEYLPELTIGEYVLVHVGFAIARIDYLEAARVFEYLAQMNELAELEGTSEEGPREIPR